MSAKRKAVEAKPMELSIAVKGEIVSSNFDDFKAFAESQIMAISFDLKTDEDFAQADEDAKKLKKFEATLAQSKTDALAQMDELNALLGSVDGLCDFARSTRLELEKRVKARKQEVRDGIVRDGIAALEVKNREFSDMIGDAIKGKSSLVKMQESVTETVERINERIQANSAVLRKALEDHGDAVAFGADAFIALTVEAAKVEMERRIERHRAAIKEAEQKAEIERLRKEGEEKARQERLAEQARVETERVKEQAAQEVAQPAPAPAAAPAPAVAAAPVVAPIATQVMREETAEEEMETFLTILRTALAPVKAARAALKHPANIEAAKHFAVTLNESFTKLLAN